MIFKHKLQILISTRHTAGINSKHPLPFLCRRTAKEAD